MADVEIEVHISIPLDWSEIYGAITIIASSNT